MTTPPNAGSRVETPKFDLQRMLRRSAELDKHACEILGVDDYELCDDTERVEASFAACELSIEHARAIRALISVGFDTTAASVLRLQFEALVRCMWLLHAATDVEVDKMQAPLTAESEKAANALPMIGKMFKALETTLQPEAFKTIDHFKATMMGALNSFVHGGIHPLRRSQEGFPPDIIDRVVRASNGVLTMAMMMAANLSGDEEIYVPMSKVARGFADCLPELLPN